MVGHDWGALMTYATMALSTGRQQSRRTENGLKSGGQRPQPHTPLSVRVSSSTSADSSSRRKLSRALKQADVDRIGDGCAAGGCGLRVTELRKDRLKAHGPPVRDADRFLRFVADAMVGSQ